MPYKEHVYKIRIEREATSRSRVRVYVLKHHTTLLGKNKPIPPLLM